MSSAGKWNLPLAYSEFLGKNTIRFDPRTPVGRAAITKQPVQVADILMDLSYIVRHPGIVAVAEDGGARTLLQVPMLKENELAIRQAAKAAFPTPPTRDMAAGRAILLRWSMRMVPVMMFLFSHLSIT
jgi:hypothetical protein